MRVFASFSGEMLGYRRQEELYEL